MIPEPVRVIKPGFDGGVADTQKLFVVAFDEGVTSGWCAMRIQLDALLEGGLRGVILRSPDPDVFAWSSGFFKGPEPWQAELMLALVRGTWHHGEGEFGLGRDSDLLVVVGEAYKSRMIGDDATVLAPVRVQAMFRGLSWREPWPFLRSPIPDAMATLPDARLKAFNLWSGVAGKDGEHQRDATRYAAMTARRCSDVGWLAELESRMPWISEKPKTK